MQTCSGLWYREHWLRVESLDQLGSTYIRIGFKGHCLYQPTTCTCTTCTCPCTTITCTTCTCTTCTCTYTTCTCTCTSCISQPQHVKRRVVTSDLSRTAKPHSFQKIQPGSKLHRFPNCLPAMVIVGVICCFEALIRELLLTL